MTNFQTLLDTATQNANIAGDKWIDEHPHGDCCGGAYIELKDKRTKFAKFLTQNDRHIWSVSINHKHRGTQHMGLNEAAIRAAYQTLVDAGIEGIRYRSYVD